MTYKSMPAGNLIDYVRSEQDYKGQKRPQPPRWIGSRPKQTEDYLRRLSPPHVKSDRQRRWVGHCRQHLTHLIIGFEESCKQAKPFRRIAIRTLECLVAAGLPLDSLQFVWCEHPLPQHSHLHGGLVRSLLPGGGPYNPALSGALAIDCSWLVSRRFGLSLPTGRARLVRGGEFSYKHVHRERLDRICAMTQEKFLKNKLNGHDDFLKMLKDDLQEPVLAAPGPDGWPRLRTGRDPGRLYRQCVAVARPDNPVIWLVGLVCRQSFSAKEAEQDQERRRKKFAHANEVYRRFVRELEQRITEQQQRYPVRKGLRVVTQDAFQWLDPQADARYLAPDSLQTHAPKVTRDFRLPEPPVTLQTPSIKLREILDPDAPSMPEAAYPFYSDLSEEEIDITDPQILLGDDLDETIEQNAWVPYELNPLGPIPGKPAPPEVAGSEVKKVELVVALSNEQEVVPKQPEMQMGPAKKTEQPAAETPPVPAPVPEMLPVQEVPVQTGPGPRGADSDLQEVEPVVERSSEEGSMPQEVQVPMPPAKQPAPELARDPAREPEQPAAKRPPVPAPVIETLPDSNTVDLAWLMTGLLRRKRWTLKYQISTLVALGCEAQRQEDRLKSKISAQTITASGQKP